MTLHVVKYTKKYLNTNTFHKIKYKYSQMYLNTNTFMFLYKLFMCDLSCGLHIIICASLFTHINYHMTSYSSQT